MEALDRVRRVDDLADLRVVGKEGHELGPGVSPQADDCRVALAPLAGELVEALPCCLLGLGGVDEPEIAGELVPVCFARVAEGVADQVEDAGLDDRAGPDIGDRLRQAAQPVADDDADVLDAAVQELLDRVTRGSAESKGIGKQALYTQIDLDQPKAYAFAIEVMAATSQLLDAKEGMRAFLGKRPPRWSRGR